MYNNNEKAVYIANKILDRHWNIKFPVDVKEIAYQMGIIVNNAPNGNLNLGEYFNSFQERLLGRLDIIDNQIVCTVNSTENTTTQRWILAQLLGHYVLEHGKTIKKLISHNKTAQDEESECFTITLLLPEKYLNLYIQSNGLNIDDMAQFFDVPNNIMQERLQSLHLLTGK